MKEWQFTDGSHSSNNFSLSSQPSLYGSSNFPSGTGRKIIITVVEGKDLTVNRSGRCDPYMKLQYGKVGLSVFFITWNIQWSKFVIKLNFLPFLNYAYLMCNVKYYELFFRSHREQKLSHILHVLPGIRSLNLMK